MNHQNRQLPDRNIEDAAYYTLGGPNYQPRPQVPQSPAILQQAHNNIYSDYSNNQERTDDPYFGIQGAQAQLNQPIFVPQPLNVAGGKGYAHGIIAFTSTIFVQNFILIVTSLFSSNFDIGYPYLFLIIEVILFSLIMICTVKNILSNSPLASTSAYRTVKILFICTLVVYLLYSIFLVILANTSIVPHDDRDMKTITAVLISSIFLLPRTIVLIAMSRRQKKWNGPQYNRI